MRKGEKTRRDIVDQAVILASITGLEGLSIGLLSERLGMSKSGLFAHFQSKEGLHILVIHAAAERFTREIVLPAIKLPRGEPRVKAMFERWLKWDSATKDNPGGCLFIAAAVEVDDRPGPVRDALVETQRQWIDTMARAAKIAVEVGHFRRNLDCRQFAFELHSLMLGLHHFGRLLEDPHAKKRSRAAFAALLERSRNSN